MPNLILLNFKAYLFLMEVKLKDLNLKVILLNIVKVLDFLNNPMEFLLYDFLSNELYSILDKSLKLLEILSDCLKINLSI